MKVIAYLRQNPDPEAAEVELAIQRASLDAWLAEHGAELVASFTESETGAKQRPVFGRALRAATQAGAVLVVADTGAIGPCGRFSPSGRWDGPRIVGLEDPAERARRDWSNASRLVIYLRTRLEGGVAAERSLAKQRAAVERIVGTKSQSVLATFVEEEGDDDEATDAAMSAMSENVRFPASARDARPDPAGADVEEAAEALPVPETRSTGQLDRLAQPPRPALQAALALCRDRQARLLIGTLDPLHRPLPRADEAADTSVNGPMPGSDLPVILDLGDVPHAVAYSAADEWAEWIAPPPEAAPASIGLFFGRHWVRNSVPLYLVNRTGAELGDVLVTSSAWTLGYGDIVTTTPGTKPLGTVPNETARLVEGYDVLVDGDFVVSWRVTASSTDGLVWSGQATAAKGLPPARFLPLADWQAQSRPAAADGSDQAGGSTSSDVPDPAA